MISLERANLICELARTAGFERVGIAPAGPVGRAEYVRSWLDAGHAGEMEYLQRWSDLRVNLGSLLPGARSVIVVGHNYRQAQWEPSPGDRPPKARVAQYAWGQDYHVVIREKLHGLVAGLRRAIPDAFDARVCVDTAPILEREAAAAAGVGWIGKNTMVIDPQLGSFFFLGEIVTTLELAPSLPMADHCGTCTRCLDACPTGALTAPYQMDARRCISYLTIEHRGDIPADLQPLMGAWLYGCDVCQDVCPHNRRAPQTRESAYESGSHPFAPEADVESVLNMKPEEYQQALSGSAMKRARLDMLQRNVRIIIANRDASRRRTSEEKGSAGGSRVEMPGGLLRPGDTNQPSAQ